MKQFLSLILVLSLLFLFNCTEKKKDTTLLLLGLAIGAGTTGSAANPYKVLKTGAGAIASYTLVSGEDGLTQIGVARSYTDNGNGTVKDNALGFIWQKCSRGQNNDETCSGTATTANWTDAGTYCSGLSLASRTWRLPTRQELETLPNFGQSSPSIDTTIFPSTLSSDYWSSSEYAQNTSRAWVVYFESGSMDHNDKAGLYNVRCVSGASKQYSSNFTDNGNGTVKDNATGLIWQKCSKGQTNDSTCSGTASTSTWATALTDCSGLSLASRTWRLPNVNELKSIIDTTKSSGPTIDTTYFPGTATNFYWSSTTFIDAATTAWHPSFNFGNLDGTAKTNSFYVRCVSGQ